MSNPLNFKIPIGCLPLEEMEPIQKAWFRDVLNEFSAKEEKSEEFLTRKETAILLKITLPTLHEWGKKGILKPHRLNSRIRYRRSEVESALNAASDSKRRRTKHG